MSTLGIKKGNKKNGHTAEERFLLSAPSPFFCKKKDAEEFLKKAVLPERPQGEKLVHFSQE